MTTTRGPGDGSVRAPEPRPFDAPVAAEMARKAEAVGVTKVSLPLSSLTTLGVLGGAFIAFGAMLSTIATAGVALPEGVIRLMGGVAFSLGLGLVVVAGAELFTGNNLIVMAFASGKVTLRQVLRSWTVVYVANFLGAVLTAAVVFGSGQYAAGTGAIGKRALEVARVKTSLPFREALLLGVLANVLVCLAVWLCLAARSVTDKIVAVVGPVTAFVAGGFEHSIANMYLIPIDIFIKRWAPDRFWSRSTLTRGEFASVDLRHFVLGNLVPVTIGNVIGGAGLVGLVYWFVYLRVERVR